MRLDVRYWTRGRSSREQYPSVSDTLRVETVSSLASRLRLTREAVVREVVAGRMPYVNVGGHWRFRDSGIEYWMKHHGRARGLSVVEPRKTGSS